MSKVIVRKKSPIALLGAGSCTSSDWEASRRLVNTVVAADGGADRALKLGITPDAVLGDMDSISAKARAAFSDRLHPIAEQDSTDFAKAIRSVDAPMLLGLGFLGKRADHQLAAFHALVRYCDRKIVLLGKHDVVCIAPPKLTIAPPVGSRFSLFPMGQVTGHSQGLEWPIEGLTFGPDTQIGTSNRVTGPVQLTFDAPKMLLLMPRAGLDLMWTALMQSAPWPARAG